MRTAFEKIKSIWSAVDIRKKILYTALILLVYRIGCAIPVPYVSTNAISTFETLYSGTIFEYMNLLSGGALAQATLFALGVSPYITAQIVMQLLTVAIPKLGKWAKEEDGQKKLTKITRYATIGLAVLTALAYYFILSNNNMLVVSEYPWLQCIVIIAAFTAGSALIMWLGDKISEKGIGNGISMILFVNIISQGFSIGFSIGALTTQWYWGTIFGVLIIAATALILYFIVKVTNSERRLTVIYAKRTSGRKVYGGQKNYLPLKLNMSGVMPIIFASSIVSLPVTITTLVGKGTATKGFAGLINNLFGTQSLLYVLLFLVLIVLFAYFYIMISFDPVEVSNNLKNNGGSIRGIRPGEKTAEYIQKILNRITFIGAIFLAVIAGVPLLVSCIASVLGDFSATAKFFGPTVLSSLSRITFGGSSLLIVIGVALETYRNIEAQMAMRHYKGFIRN